MSAKQQLVETNEAARPCADCDCSDLVGAPGAKFCTECGHGAASHEAPIPAGCEHADCECEHFDGGPESRFCGSCGHPASAHLDRGADAERHLVVAPEPDGEAETKPMPSVSAAKPARTSKSAPDPEPEPEPEPDRAPEREVGSRVEGAPQLMAVPVVQVGVAANPQKDTEGGAWMTLIVTALTMTVLAAVAVYAFQWRAERRDELISKARAQTAAAQKELAAERKEGTNLEARIERREADVKLIAGKIAKLDAGPAVIGSVKQAQARRDNFKKRVESSERTLASARSNASSATSVVRSW